MKKKMIISLLTAVAMTCVLTACGAKMETGTQTPDAAEEGVQNTDEQEETADVNEEEAGETEAGAEEADAPGSETDALEAFEAEISRCYLNDTQLSYETIEGDGYSYFRT